MFRLLRRQIDKIEWEDGQPILDRSDYRDWECWHCGHEWRIYGNGGLVLGMWPECPKCGTSAEQA
jgi:hypothetical protein